MYHDIEVEDLASAVVLFKNGAQGVFQASITDPIMVRRIEICGEKGKIQMDENVRKAILEKTVKDYIVAESIWNAGQKISMVRC